jgi:hypothetical protein
VVAAILLQDPPDLTGLNLSDVNIEAGELTPIAGEREQASVARPEARVLHNGRVFIDRRHGLAVAADQEELVSLVAAGVAGDEQLVRHR